MTGSRIIVIIDIIVTLFTFIPFNVYTTKSKNISTFWW